MTDVEVLVLILYGVPVGSLAVYILWRFFSALRDIF